MATNKEFIDYVCEKLQVFDSIICKKMFGEYLIYKGLKPFFLVCDNIVFVKEYEELYELLKNNEKAHPYNGARLHYVVDIDNVSLLKEVFDVLDVVVRIPKKKVKKA